MLDSQKVTDEGKGVVGAMVGATTGRHGGGGLRGEEARMAATDPASGGLRRGHRRIIPRLKVCLQVGGAHEVV
jgi:hypothetical protein